MSTMAPLGLILISLCTIVSFLVLILLERTKEKSLALNDLKALMALHLMAISEDGIRADSMFLFQSQKWQHPMSKELVRSGVVWDEKLPDNPYYNQLHPFVGTGYKWDS